MPAVQVRFHRCVQDSQDFGSDDEHMVSRVFFTLIVDGKADGDYTADVKQTVGEPYEPRRSKCRSRLDTKALTTIKHSSAVSSNTTVVWSAVVVPAFALVTQLECE